MFARFIQRLTLLAFTAHAVLGCCWHHSHAMKSIGCAEHGSHASEVEASCHDHCSVDDHSKHLCHVSDPILNASEDCDRNIAAMQAMCGGCPNEHSHVCDEGRCRYVAVKSQLLGFDRNACTLQWGCCSAKRFPVVGGVSSCRRIDSPILDRLATSSRRCASLQSWQI
ncbi:hypothetical protein Poly51_63090 [Rubripirellula tenax]|uniref:Secreted protein n=1 Tax=Rubripirellula tenax TaxID=2528015 RepID=A0A5C6E6K3_9BACT|nr:hypothetical protein Poly51_63090 [Rubripirellula tenax]